MLAFYKKQVKWYAKAERENKGTQKSDFIY